MDTAITMVTDTTVRTGINSQSKHKIKVLAATLSCLFSAEAFCDWTFSPELETRLEAYNKSLSANQSIDNEILTITPKFNAIFDGSRNDVVLSLRHVNIVSNDTDLAENRHYDSYQFSSNNSYFSNAVNLNLTSSRNYRTRNAADSFSFDLFEQPDSFAKTDQSSAQLGFQLPNPRYFQLSTVVYAAQTKSKQLEQGEQFAKVNSNSYSGQVNLANGKKIHSAKWNLNIRQIKTERENAQDFDSFNLDGKLSFPFFNPKVRFVLVGKQEDNDIGSSNDQLSDAYDQSSYGAGLEWFLSNVRYLTLTYNRTEKNFNDQDQEYLGADFKWAFSTRNSIAAAYDKRFYGDAYRFSFEHSGKKLNLRASYNEDLTTQSRLNLNTQSNILVCPTGSLDLAECFQPEAGYQLQPGEQGYSFDQYIPELIEQAFLRKAGNISISWKARKLTVALGANKGSTEYLESSRKQDTQSLSLNSNWQLSRKTRIYLNANHAEIQEQTQLEPDTTESVSLGLSRELGRSISTRLELRYLDRDSPVDTRTYIDKRLTASVVIKY